MADRLKELSGKKEIRELIEEGDHKVYKKGGEEKYSDEQKEAFKSVQQWSGDQYEFKHITSVIDMMKEAEFEDKDLKVYGATYDQFQLNTDRKINDIMRGSHQGLLHNDLTNGQAKEILWGMIMSARNGKKFLK